MEEQAQKIADILKLLSNKNRLLILCSLLQGPQTVGEIHKNLSGISGSALSQHLGQLKTAGILSSEKQGMHVFYQINDSRILALMETLKCQYCSPGNH